MNKECIEKIILIKHKMLSILLYNLEKSKQTELTKKKNKQKTNKQINLNKNYTNDSGTFSYLFMMKFF